MRIHELALVQDGCQVGSGTIVWQFASILRGADIGKSCVIGACSVVDGSFLGDGCSIGHGAQVHPGALLGDNVFVGPGAIICNDMWPSVNKEGFNLRGPPIVKIEENVSIGAGAIILPGITLYEGSKVAAGAVVDSDVGKGMIFRRDRNVTRYPEDWIERRMRYAQ